MNGPINVNQFPWGVQILIGHLIAAVGSASAVSGLTSDAAVGSKHVVGSISVRDTYV